MDTGYKNSLIIVSRRVLIIMCAIILLLSSSVLAAERSSKMVRDFRRENPCPATGVITGKCPGWVVDHIIPLCFGGADALANMQWQEIKASHIKDRFEREACRLKKACKVGD